MQNDSIESLLSRHYGNTAATPAHLEERLYASVCAQEQAQLQQEQMTTRLRNTSMSRRQAVRLVALGAASLSLLSIGLESISPAQREMAHPAYS
ncbi:MAG: hypothetical protein M3Z24_12540 [Chloroflexota bacterium]|nr:hypothetical protein [Chloroflexota bacterium]